jgi:alpha-tubulin suppressor-like RCC1 family protein
MQRFATETDSRPRMIRWLAAGTLATTLALVPTAAGAASRPTAAGLSVAEPAAAAAAGTLLAWGDDSDGELGNGTRNTVFPSPILVHLPAGTTVTQVRGGCLHTVALTSDGQVLTWGNNDFGQLGDGTTTTRTLPVQVTLPPGMTVRAVRAGCFYTMALTSTGQIFAWGRNTFGNLGDGTTTERHTPIQVLLPAGTTVKAISAGANQGLALTTAGKVFAWGLNQFGQLGDRTTTERDRPVPVKMPAGVTVAGLAAGSEFSMALTGTGQVLAWGSNESGQLGDGTTTDRHRPVPVRLPVGTKVRGLFGGAFHAVALTTTGKVLTWGDNTHGQLGDGTTAERHRPVTVRLPAGTTVTAVSAGEAHSLVLAKSGKAFAWGWNATGELGNDTTTGSKRPVQVDLGAREVATALGAGPGAQFSLAIVHLAP